MKKSLVFLSILAIAFSAIVFSNAHNNAQVVKASTYVEGYYARTGDDTTKNTLYFYMEENAAPYNSDSSLRYRPMTRDAIKLVKENGEEKLLPVDYPGNVEAITKYNTTKYCLESWIFNNIGGVDVGDTIILNGDFYYPTGDVTLHIKESKFYVDSEQKVSTLPHNVNNVSTYLHDSVPSVTTDPNHGWACLFWAPSTMTYEILPRTRENGYYPTSQHNLYINGEPKARLDRDLLRRRDEWGTEVYVCLNDQTGVPNPSVGTLIVVDGLLCYKNFINRQYPENPIISLEKGEYFGIEVNFFAFLKVGEGTDDYQVVDLKSYLLDDFNELYDYDIYDVEDFYTLKEIKTTLSIGINNARNVKEVYAAYNLALEQVSHLEKSEDGFETYKNNKKEEIRNYVSLDNYFDAERLTVEGYINSCCAQIDYATTTKQILGLIAQAKSNIDSVKTRVDIMENAILNQTPGYEQYLQSYDEVTLDDLSLGESQTFHGRKNQRDGEINTNNSDKNQFNSFVPNSENKKGNVVFNFYYQSNCVPTGGGNLSLVLRGIRYYGYKLVIGTDSRGLYFTKTTPKGDEFIKGFSSTFSNTSQRYPVSVGMIDLIEGDRTWATIKVGGATLYSAIIDSLPFCTNARVSLSNNGNEFSDTDGTTTISNYYPSSATSKISPIYGGIFEYEEGHSDVTTNLYMTLDENSVDYDVNKNIGSYATRVSDIKFTRGSSTYDIARTDIPVIAKYGPNSYQLYLSQLFNNTITNVINGDKVTISGVFTYYDENAGNKIAYEIANSTFVYDAVHGKWNVELSLVDCKEDAIRRINYRVVEDALADYDDVEKQAITSLASQYVNQVNSATSVESVKELYNSFIEAFNNVPTRFEKYRQNKISEIENYLSSQSEEYYEEDWQEILDIKAEAISNLESATNYQEIDQIFESAIQRIDSVLTIRGHKLEELNEAKRKAISEVKNHYASLDLNSMSNSEIEELNADTLDTIDRIKAALSVPQVEQLLNNYKLRHKLPSQNANTKGCGGSVYTTSILLSAISLLGIALISYKKRKQVMEDF